MKSSLLLCLIPTVLMEVAAAQSSGRRVLVYTRNTVTPASTYIHDNISSSVEAIRKMGAEHDFTVDVSGEPDVFTADNLRRYQAIVFSNTKNEAFETEDQRRAFRNYVQRGGGLVGLHSATTTERQWPYFVSLLGGKFVRHPELQKFVVKVLSQAHPATRGLPATFEWEDECYFHDSLAPDLHPLLVTDPAALNDPEMGKYPHSLLGKSLALAWTRRANGVRVFYTALGHKKEHYANPLLVKHIEGGLLWAMGDLK